jgi:hypothetical protein
MPQGSCYCGAISFSVDGELSGVISCHCRDCQRINGNFNALVVADKDAVTIEGEELMTWYHTSPGIRRSFCSRCGSRLFKDKGTPKLIISAGAFEPPLQLPNAKNLWVESAASWYDVTPEHS